MPRASEELIEEYGREIFERMEGEKPSVFKTDWWSGKVMDFAMEDPEFKVQMFRFVDVFPMLKRDNQVARHLQEYFGGEDQEFPVFSSMFKWGLSKIQPGSRIAGLAASQIETQIQSMAGKFIAGQDASEALPELREMWSDDIAFTVDLLGEATVSEDEARGYYEKYQQILDTLIDETEQWPERSKLEEASFGEVPRMNLSVKISSLYSQLDPVHFDHSVEKVKERLRPLFRNAVEHDIFINLDVEQYHLKDLTLAAFKSLLEEDEFRDFEHAGVVVQAYLRDSEEDVHELCEWAEQRGTPVTVRLVKGAYWDYETIRAEKEGWPSPVYTEKWRTDRNFEKLTGILLDHHDVIHTAVGSHNVRSISHAMAYAEELGIPPSGLEFQMLYGMAEPMKAAVSGMDYRLRDYVPIGEMIPGMAYLVRRLLENTSNESWLRASFAEGADVGELLATPEPDDPDAATEEEGLELEPVTEHGFRNEPHRDFAKSRHRDNFAEAIEQVRDQLGGRYMPQIGGREIRTDRMIRSNWPADPETTVGEVLIGGEDETKRALRSAWKARDDWASTPPEERAEHLLEIADRMRERRDELAAWMVFESAKNWRESDADVCEAIDFCEYYAREMKRLGDPRKMGDVAGEHDLLTYQPRGVAAVIAPWNFPLAILTGMTMAAAVTGNTVIVKPAEQSPVIAAKLMEIVRESGMPDGVVNYLPGLGEEVGQQLVASPYVHVIAFTGSRDVGLDIIRRAGKTEPRKQEEVKKVVCEMGGKNAIIVDGDADLDEAVQGVVESAFGYSGQKCSACSRAIVLEHCYEEFRERLVEATRSLIVGPPDEPESFVSPVIDESARKKIEAYKDLGREEGELLIEREDLPDDGRFVGPAVFDDVAPDARIAQEEIFGPVLALIEAEDFDEAIEIANGTNYGLTGGVYSRSPAHIEQAYAEFDVGNLYINQKCTGALVHRQPFGGFKMSGVGSKAGGPDYLLQFMEPRAISENTERRGFAPEQQL